MRRALGIDVGATKIAAAVLEPGGREIGAARRDTEAATTEALVEEIHACAADALAQAGFSGPSGGAPLDAVGVGIPAQVERDGTIPHCTYLPFLEDSDVIARLKHSFPVPVAVENDANLAALGEARFGAEPTDSLVFLTLGTGIGGGVVIDGQMLRGPHGSAGEIGHMVIVAGGPPCACGQRGCLEALVAGPFIARRAREGMASSDDGAGSSLAHLSGGADSLTAEDVVEAARAGDVYAARLIHETAGYLGGGLSSLANIFAPERMVIGGGLGEAAADLLLPVAREVVDRDALAGSRRGLVIEAASLGQRAGVVGAAAFALEGS